MEASKLEKGKIYRQKTTSLKGFDLWRFTGITFDHPNGSMWYHFYNDRGGYYFDNEDLTSFTETNRKSF